MKLNCKPGDMAVVVRSSAGNEGKIVCCIRLSNWTGLIGPSGTMNHGAVWEVDRPLRAWSGESNHFVLDKSLRPIRDNPGEDETLSWAEIPSKQKAPA
jgi:hypothetical protein